jgi:hypothetical protein
MTFWEYVNVILTISTSVYVPNLYSTSFLPVYTDVFGWMFIPAELANTSAKSIASWHILSGSRRSPVVAGGLLLAGGQALP